MDLTTIMAALGSSTIVSLFIDSLGNALSYIAGLGGYATVVPGATLATWKVLFWGPGGTQLSAGAYPTSLIATSKNESLQVNIIATKLI